MKPFTFNDIRTATRYLWHQKWATAAAMVPLALSIGVCVAVFHIAKSTVLRTLTVPAPEQLVMVQEVQAGGGGFRRFSLPELESFRRASGGRAEVTGYAASETLLGDQFSERRINAALVADNYFEVLRAAPALGTLFSEPEDAWGASPIAVLSYQFWQWEFGGRPDAVGSDIVLDGRPFRVVGVSQSSFLGLQPTLRHDLYLPLNMKPALTPSFSIPQANAAWLYVFARVPTIQDRTALTTAWTVAFNDQGKRFHQRRQSRIALRDAGFGNPYQEQDIRDLVSTLAWGGCLVLLVAFFSAAGVVSAMELEERRRMGTRLVLGATFGDLARIWLDRMMVLAVPTALAAYSISALLADWLLSQYSGAYPERLTAGIRVGWQALVLSLGLGTVISLLLSSLVWVESRRLDLVTLVHDSSPRAGRSRSKLQSWLTAGQVALAAATLVAGGIALRYWSAIENRDLGYRPQGLAFINVQMDFRSAGGGPGSGEVILGQLFDRLSALPAIREFSASRFPLLVSAGATFTVRPERSAASDSDLRGLACHWVAPSWFKTIGARMIAGREFNEEDGYFAPGVAVVNESFAQRVWPGQSAIGKRIGAEPVHRDVEVIGVLRDFQSLPSLELSALPGLYLSLMQIDDSRATLVLRGNGDASSALAGAKTVLREFGSAVKVLEAGTLEQKLARLLWKQRFYGTLVKLIVALSQSSACMQTCAALSHSGGRNWLSAWPWERARLQW